MSVTLFSGITFTPMSTRTLVVNSIVCDAITRTDDVVTLQNIKVNYTYTHSASGNVVYMFFVGAPNPSGSPQKTKSPRVTGNITVGAGTGSGTSTLGNLAITVDKYDAQYSLGSQIALTTGSVYSSLYTKTISFPRNHPLYGSVNGRTKAIQKLYGSVNGKTKEIKKLYGSVNGKTKRIF